MKTNKEDIRNKVVDNLDMSREAENSEIHEIIDEINELYSKISSFGDESSSNQLINWIENKEW